ncbi:MAG: biopolymer transporter ExbD [Proteobacteria bacterium]|nr:biopolymer transporter ExbD [Pseudomonadota bacterium]MCP4920855.1 biopolymer transporter ExbD [Pseudomonadota bacterium]
MGAKVGGDKGGPVNEINVTPLIDVVLVLLIIFMVVTPMLSSGIDVTLPDAKKTTQAQDNGQHLVLSIDAEGDIYLDRDQVELENLIDEVNASYRKDPSKVILIKGDAGLHYLEVRQVMDELAEGGWPNQLLAVEKIKEDE